MNQNKSKILAGLLVVGLASVSVANAEPLSEAAKVKTVKCVKIDNRRAGKRDYISKSGKCKKGYAIFINSSSSSSSSVSTQSVGQQGIQGVQGEKGDTGATGPQGPQGEPG